MYLPTVSPNLLSPSNKNIPLPSQQSLQPPVTQSRKDSASSQGSAAGSGYGSTAQSFRSANGSIDQSAQMRSSPQDRRMYQQESRQSPSPGPGNLQQNYSFQKQPPQQHSQSARQEETAAPVSHTRQRTMDQDVPPAHNRVLSKSSMESGQPSGPSRRPNNESQPSYPREPVKPALAPLASSSMNPASQSPQGVYTPALRRDVSGASLQAGTPISQKNDRSPARMPSPPPSMMVEPPTPIPGDIATMETMQDERPFEHDRGAMQDVPARPSRGNAESTQPPAIRAPEMSTASTNGAKQRARLAPIVTSTDAADASSTKPKTTLDVSSAGGKPADSIDRRAQMRRASFHPSAQPTAGYSRDVLLRSSFAVTGAAGDLLEDPASGDKALEDETLANVEELLEGFDWGSMDPSRGDEQRGGATEVFESRLLDELNALEAVRETAFLLRNAKSDGLHFFMFRQTFMRSWKATIVSLPS